MASSSAVQFLFKAAPVDPVTATVLKTFYEIFELHTCIKAVDEQNKDLLSTTHHVAFNVQEARRLRRTKTSFLDYSENLWMENVIKDTEEALLAVAQLIEPIRVNRVVKQKIDFGNKVEWVFKQNAQVAGKHARLNTCCQFLTTVIASLHSKNAGVPAPMLEEHVPPYNFSMERFLNWESHRKRRRSSISSSGETNDTRSRSSHSDSTITDLANTASLASTAPTDLRGSILSLPEALRDSVSKNGVDPSKSCGCMSPRTRPASEPSPPKLRRRFASSISVQSWPELEEEESTQSTFDGSDYFSNPAPTSHLLSTTFDSTSTPSDIAHASAIQAPLQPCYDGADGLQVYNPYMSYSTSRITDESLRSTIMSPAEIDSPSQVPYPKSRSPKSPDHNTSLSMPDPHTYRLHTSDFNPPRSPDHTSSLSIPDPHTYRPLTSDFSPPKNPNPATTPVIMPEPYKYRRHTTEPKPGSGIRTVSSTIRQSLENLRTRSDSFYQPSTHHHQEDTIEDVS